jgi:protein-S-isoprenylcysteine O-methyltransferase Ste14
VTGSPGRGGAWVVAQFALMAVLVVVLVVGPRWPGAARTGLAVAGVALAVSGAAVAGWAGRVLGRALTPFPRPVTGGSLVEAGPFRLVRHPIYTGGALFFAGLSLVAGPAALALTGLLVVLWAYKARIEERHLVSRYAGYARYAERVRYRFVPGVY